MMPTCGLANMDTRLVDAEHNAEDTNQTENKSGPLASSFEELGLQKWLASQCKVMGVNHPTPVQQNCIPAILKGKDCIGCAHTGSGKTLAFALPIIQKLAEDPYGIFALVLTPTRELAFQIADQFRVMGKTLGLKDCVIVGGMDMVTQGHELSQSPHVVISTPGRLADHLESCNTFTLKHIRFLVLDEADRLLDGRFNEQLKTIFSVLPKKRQTLLFSATITPTLEELRRIAMSDPFYWSAPGEVATVDQLDQRYVLTPTHVRDSYLVHIINRFVDENPKRSVMIFAATCNVFVKIVFSSHQGDKLNMNHPQHAFNSVSSDSVLLSQLLRGCQVLSMALKSLGFDNVALHSMMKQRQRLAALNSFKSNTVRILVATDVASRGLDIPTVEMVLNHNVPHVAKDYVHRVGRTARAGRGGLAVTLVTEHDIKLVHEIEKLINTKLKLYKTEEKAVLKILTQVAVAMREAEIRLDEMDFGEKKMINKRKKLILEGKDPDEEEAKKERLKKQKLKHLKKLRAKNKKSVS